MDMTSNFCDSNLMPNFPFPDTLSTAQLSSPSNEPDVDWTVFENADRYLLRDDNAWIARLGKEFWWNLERMTEMIVTEHTTNTLQQQVTTGQLAHTMYNRLNNTSNNPKNIVNFNASHAQPSSASYTNGGQPPISSSQQQVSSTSQQVGNLNALHYQQPTPQLQPPSSAHYNNQHHFNSQQLPNATQYNGDGSKTNFPQQALMNNNNFMPRKIVGQRNQSSNNSSMNSNATPINNNNYPSSNLFNSDMNQSSNGTAISPPPPLHSGSSSSSSSTISAYSAITRPNGSISAVFSNNTIPDKMFNGNITNNNSLFQAFASTFNDQLPMDGFSFNPFKSNISFDNNTWQQQQPITNWQ
ncbi:unnamed protein product [Didymodactylos carnosus]|uniref:Uncharacterized protein n=1 Tax=Didymodactylos carnosus TaxID=1234261 RepID=A0A814NHB2_9BILA|nr:unnamed protein product [Didymodactylos carnosus]CAF1092920.1 unnamed protein product [Didymodactylos carnosus]CAF3656135.1 unnamed protein product [Didymodactylos carnosus]CAF3858331.1 unnamed protein product [Didymodactylos carnosus]